LILNKIDLISPGELNSLKAILRKLNPGAQFIETKFGVTSPSTILNTGLFNQKEVSMLPGWNQELYGSGSTHTPETEEYGISSFIYSAERPFQTRRLASLVKDGVAKWGVIRSKGLIWNSSDYKFAREWSQAGSSMALQPGPRWRDEPDEDSKYRGCRFGDRRQELVFIGQNMKETEIRTALDDALLSEKEFASYLEFQDESDEWATPAAKKARNHV